ncbi:MAG: hypothetical protein ABR911_14110 [Syntrophales bacterium]
MSVKTKRLKADDKKQSARFIETAERIAIDNSETKFEEAIKRLLNTPPKKKSKKKK